MDHAEVRDRLGSSFLAPGGLAALDVDADEDAGALGAHLADCPDCAAEYRAWQIAGRVMAENVPEALSAPVGARERTLAAVAMTGVRRPATDMARPSATPRPGVLAIAAGLAAALFMVGALLGGPLGLVPRDGGDASLTDNQAAAVAAAVDRVLQQPAHMMVPLLDASGAAGGSVLFDPESRELVVLSQALEVIPAGAEYGCYLERDGERIRVGRLRVVGEAAYWMGPMPDPQDAGRNGDRFLVVRDDRPETPVLSGGF